MTAKGWAVAPLVVLAVTLTAGADEIRGVIDRVDSGAKEVVVQGRGRGVRGLRMVFEVDPAARIQLGSATGDLADLQPGDRVRLFYEQRDGSRVAVAISTHALRRQPAVVTADKDTLSGTLARVAAADRHIVVIGSGPGEEDFSETALTVPENARITRDGHRIKLDDLREGEHVVVRTQKGADKPSAVQIQVGAAAVMDDRGDRIERARQVLKMVDWVLQQMSEQK